MKNFLITLIAGTILLSIAPATSQTSDDGGRPADALSPITTDQQATDQQTTEQGSICITLPSNRPKPTTEEGCRVERYRIQADIGLLESLINMLENEYTEIVLNCPYEQD